MSDRPHPASPTCDAISQHEETCVLDLGHDGEHLVEDCDCDPDCCDHTFDDVRWDIRSAEAFAADLGVTRGFDDLISSAMCGDCSSKEQMVLAAFAQAKLRALSNELAGASPLQEHPEP